MFISMLSYSQTANFDARLLIRYNLEELNNLKQTEPQFVEYLTYKLDHSYFFISIDINTDKVYPMLYEIDYSTKIIQNTQVENVDPNNFNILKYSIESNPKNRIVYRIGNSGLGLALYSDNEVVAKFNKSKN